jgi:hypothetical protein
MSCGCKSNGNNITENSAESVQKNKSILNSMGTMGPMNPNNPIIVRLIYFSIAAPLVLLLLPAVYIILFNHIVIGNPTNLVNLLKKILLIDFVNKIKLKIRERRLRKEEEELMDGEDGEYEYEDVYITPIDRVESDDEIYNGYEEKIDSKETK